MLYATKKTRKSGLKKIIRSTNGFEKVKNGDDSENSNEYSAKITSSKSIKWQGSGTVEIVSIDVRVHSKFESSRE